MSAIIANSPPSHRTPEESGLACVVGHWVGILRVYLHAIHVVRHQLPIAATRVETATRELSVQFQHLARGAEEQSQQMTKIIDLCGSLELEGSRITLDDFSALFSETLASSIDTILYVSKRAITMVYMLDEAMQELISIENFLNDIQSINKKANLLALNATIEAVRAGELGRGFKIVASEVKDVSSHVRELARHMRQEIEKVSKSVRAGYEVLKDVATTDMSKNIIAQDKLRELLKSLMKQNDQFGAVLAESAKATEIISRSISCMVMDMQFQDRNTQYIENSVQVLSQIEQGLTQFMEECRPFLPGQILPDPDEATISLISGSFRMSTFTQLFLQSLQGKPLQATDIASDAANGSESVELF